MKKKKYEAQGFIEALMAILIAGIAVVAFMAVTTKTLSEVARSEIRDQLVQEAVQGSTLIDYAVERRNVNDDEINSEALFDLANYKYECVELDGNFSGNAEDYIKIGPDKLCQLDLARGINPSDCVGSELNWNKASIEQKYASSRYDYQDQMFRIVCIDPDSNFDDTGGILITRIYTGTESCRDYNQKVRNLDSSDESCIVQEYRSVYIITPDIP